MLPIAAPQVPQAGAQAPLDEAPAPVIIKKNLVGLPGEVYNVHCARGPHWGPLGNLDDNMAGIVAPPTYEELREWAYMWVFRGRTSTGPYAPWRTSVVHYRNGHKAYCSTRPDFVELAYDPQAPRADPTAAMPALAGNIPRDVKATFLEFLVEQGSQIGRDPRDMRAEVAADIARTSSRSSFWVYQRGMGGWQNLIRDPPPRAPRIVEDDSPSRRRQRDAESMPPPIFVPRRRTEPPPEPLQHSMSESEPEAEVPPQHPHPVSESEPEGEAQVPPPPPLEPQPKALFPTVLRRAGARPKSGPSQP